MYILTQAAIAFIESFRLEKNFEIIESNHEPNTARTTTKPCPLVPYLHIF